MSVGTKRQLQSKLFRTMSTAPVSQPVSHPTFTPDGGGGGEKQDSKKSVVVVPYGVARSATKTPEQEFFAPGEREVVHRRW